MILNPTNSIINDSQKISELRKLTKVTKHQENTWIPIAQFNSRTATYTNAAINLQAITSYAADRTYAYFSSELGEDWVRLRNINNYESHTDLQDKIHASEIANNMLAYSFSYITKYFDWQIVNGTYIPGYIPPMDLDDVYDGKTPEIHENNYIEVEYYG